MASSNLVANFPIQTFLRGRDPGEMQCPTGGRLPFVELEESLPRQVDRRAVMVGVELIERCL